MIDRGLSNEVSFPVDFHSLVLTVVDIVGSEFIALDPGTATVLEVLFPAREVLSQLGVLVGVCRDNRLPSVVVE